MGDDVRKARITKVADYEARIDGDPFAVNAMLNMMRSDGRLARVGENDLDSGAPEVTVLVELCAPPSLQEIVTESPSLGAPAVVPQRRVPVVERVPAGVWRVLGISVAALAAAGVSIAVVLGVLWVAEWLWALITANVLAIVTMFSFIGLVAYGVSSGRSERVSASVPVSVPSHKVGRSRSVSVPSSKMGRSRSVFVPKRQVSVDAVRSSDVRPKVQRQDKSTTGNTLLSDPLTRCWLAKLRDKNSGQSLGMWRGAHYDLVAQQYGGDITTAVTMHGNDCCAIGYLLELDEPYSGSWGRNGKKHPAMTRVREKYGNKLIDAVISMNDRGYSLRKIADYVEREVGKRY